MNRKIIIIIGLFSLFVCVLTWTLDLTGLVEQCIYCRTERTIIGLLGLFMLLPAIKYLFSYLGYVFGFYGSHVAAAQIFMNIRHGHFGMMLTLSTAALFWIIFQIYIILWYNFHYTNNLTQK